jgi:2,5-diamino-6-(ribosylamino)-4(3H)-pyrimidinone 5'-phosphate reductase
VLINMVASLDGKATIDGKAGVIGSPTDRTLMRTLRARVDAVMVGAGTLRAEKLTLAVPENLSWEREIRGLNPQPLAVVAAATGDVPLRENLLSSSPDNLLVLASPEASEECLVALSSQASVEVVMPKGTAATKGPRLDLTVALETLKKRYAVDVLLVEGGPALNHALVSTALADELFLTLAPKLLGGKRPGALTILEGSPIPPGKSRKPEPISIHLSTDELFLRYALRPPGRAF